MHEVSLESGLSDRPQFLGTPQCLLERIDYIVRSHVGDYAAAFQFVAHIGPNLNQQHRGAVAFEVGDDFFDGEDAGGIDEGHVAEPQYERRRRSALLVDESGALTFASDAANVYWGQRPGCLLKATLSSWRGALRLPAPAEALLISSVGGHLPIRRQGELTQPYRASCREQRHEIQYRHTRWLA
jgi:hypothetical protein